MNKSVTNTNNADERSTSSENSASELMGIASDTISSAREIVEEGLSNTERGTAVHNDLESFKNHLINDFSTCDLKNPDKHTLEGFLDTSRGRSELTIRLNKPITSDDNSVESINMVFLEKSENTSYTDDFTLDASDGDYYLTRIRVDDNAIEGGTFERKHNISSFVKQ